MVSAWWYLVNTLACTFRMRTFDPIYTIKRVFDHFWLQCVCLVRLIDNISFHNLYYPNSSLSAISHLSHWVNCCLQTLYLWFICSLPDLSNLFATLCLACSNWLILLNHSFSAMLFLRNNVLLMILSLFISDRQVWCRSSYRVRFSETKDQTYENKYVRNTKLIKFHRKRNKTLKLKLTQLPKRLSPWYSKMHMVQN